jgi:hypothetical protein
MGNPGEGASPGELGVYGLLFHKTRRDELRRFVDRTIGAVLEYDARRHSDQVLQVHLALEVHSVLSVEQNRVKALNGGSNSTIDPARWTGTKPPTRQQCAGLIPTQDVRMAVRSGGRRGVHARRK